jgi:FG-GAP-like repeat/ASPIC and UnbV
MFGPSSSALCFTLLLGGVALLATIPSRQQEAKTSFYQSEGTKKMAALLRKIYEDTDWKADPNKPAERAEYYRALLKTRQLSIENELIVRQELANELLRTGDSQGAVDTLEDLRRLIKQKAVSIPAKLDRDLHEVLAISYLRLGEQENCLHFHGQKSCIFPLRGSGVHALPRGAEGAVRELTSLVEQDPSDAESRWLLNVAYMQLGRYPRDVPTKWLIPEKPFDSEYDVGDFPDVASLAGLAVTGHSGGAVMEDFDGDGLLDLMVSSSGPLDPLHFFHNNGDGTFSDRSREAGLTGETGGLNIVVTDYNNDGYPDLLILRGGWWGKFGHYPLSLLRNNDNGTFDDVTESAGLMSPYPTQTAAWADFDNDGWLDLYVGHESTPGDPNPSQLFHNNGDGTFTEVALPTHLAEMGFVKGVAWGDFNNDGRPDLYVSIKGGSNRLFRNDGPQDPKHPKPDQWIFTDVSRKTGVTEPKESFATWFFDFDNDGWPDIFVAGYSTTSMHDVGAFEIGLPCKAETPRLYRNNHDGTFTEVSKAMHLNRAILTMGASFGDLDNDGWLDIYLGTGEPSYQALLPNKMFRNNQGKGFQDVTTSGGFGHLQKGHSVAFGDLENNGNEDIFEEMGGALPGDTYQSVLYHNPGHGNHWITLELEGVKTNRAAFGARIHVTVAEGSNKREIYRTVGYGSSFGGNPLRQHIGLGKATEVEKLEVTWPTTKLTQTFRDVPADRMFHLREGETELKLVAFKPALITALNLHR